MSFLHEVISEYQQRPSLIRRLFALHIAESLLLPLDVVREILEITSAEPFLYVFGGCIGALPSTASWTFSTLTNEWKEIPPLPSERCNFSALFVKGCVWVLGGMPSTKSVDIYDPITASWSVGPELLTARWDFGAAVLGVGGVIFLFGGDGPAGPRSACNFRCGKWSNIAPMKFPKRSASAAVIGEEIYVVGGEKTSGRLSIEVYSSQTDQWRQFLPSLEVSPLGVSVFNNSGTLTVLSRHGCVHRLSASKQPEACRGQKWLKGPAPKKKRSGRSCATQGRIYHLGGVEKDFLDANSCSGGGILGNDNLPDVEVLWNSVWIDLPPLPRPLRDFALAVSKE